MTERHNREAQVFNLLEAAQLRGTLPAHLAEGLAAIKEGTYTMKKSPLQPFTFDYGANGDPNPLRLNGFMHEDDAAIIEALVDAATIDVPEDATTRVSLFEVLCAAFGWDRRIGDNKFKRITSAVDTAAIANSLHGGNNALARHIEKASKRVRITQRIAARAKKEEDEEDDVDFDTFIPKKAPKTRG